MGVAADKAHPHWHPAYSFRPGPAHALPALHSAPASTFYPSAQAGSGPAAAASGPGLSVPVGGGWGSGHVQPAVSWLHHHHAAADHAPADPGYYGAGGAGHAPGSLGHVPGGSEESEWGQSRVELERKRALALEESLFVDLDRNSADPRPPTPTPNLHS